MPTSVQTVQPLALSTNSREQGKDGLGDRPDLLADMVPEFLHDRVPGVHGIPAQGTTDWPVVSSAAPTTAASATTGWLTRADSISAVESRWREKFITSSTRPSCMRTMKEASLCCLNVSLSRKPGRNFVRVCLAAGPGAWVPSPRRWPPHG